MHTDQNITSADTETETAPDSDQASAIEPDGVNTDDSIATFKLELPDVTEIDESYESPAPEPSESESEIDHDQSTDNAAEKLRGTLDDKGGAYDPSVHTFPPEKTPTGKWKKIPKSKLAEKAPEEIAESSNALIRKEAQKAASLYATAHVGFFGADGQPTNPAYFGMLVDSFEKYMIENGVVELPASVDAILSMGIYTFDISSKPANREKIKSRFSKISGFFKKRFGKNKKPVETIQQKEEFKTSA